MKIKVKKPIEEYEVELALPYYSKQGCIFHMITTREECIAVFSGRPFESIGWTSMSSALAGANEPCTKEEFETAFESVLLIIKDRCKVK